MSTEQTSTNKDGRETGLSGASGSPLCRQCDGPGPLKTGWTNAQYCSEQCERKAVAALHNAMPGGPSPHAGWIPAHISREINRRWSLIAGSTSSKP